MGLIPHRRGWREASTFSAFCDRHDTTTFTPLEVGPYTGSKQQMFLIAYRAICWELYQKEKALKGKFMRREVLDQGVPEYVQRQIQRMLKVQDAGFEKGLNELIRVKGSMDESLLAEDYSLYSTYQVHLQGPVAVAATGAITPNLTLGGKSLQTLHDPNIQTQWLAFGTDIGTSGPIAVFLWRTNELAAEQYMEEVKALCDRELADFLIQFYFVHCENTYFASSWWEALDSPQQGFVAELMANFNPYYSPPNYRLDRAVAPWRVLSRCSN